MFFYFQGQIRVSFYHVIYTYTKKQSIKISIWLDFDKKNALARNVS